MGSFEIRYANPDYAEDNPVAPSTDGSGAPSLWYVGAAPNFEGKGSYSVSVNVNDTTVGANPDAAQAFTLNVTDVNEAANAGADLVASASENVLAGVTLATVSGSDLDLGGGNDDSNTFENLTYTITAGNG